MKKIILVAAIALFFASCGMFPKYSYIVRCVDQTDYFHPSYLHYDNDSLYKIGDTITIDGTVKFKAKVIDVRY